MILAKATIPMQGLIVGEVVEVDETDERIAKLLKASALVPVDAPKRRKRADPSE